MPMIIREMDEGENMIPVGELNPGETFLHGSRPDYLCIVLERTEETVAGIAAFKLVKLEVQDRVPCVGLERGNFFSIPKDIRVAVVYTNVWFYREQPDGFYG